MCAVGEVMWCVIVVVIVCHACSVSAESRWPNPDGLDLIVGKAGLRVTLGFTDVSDLADNSDRDTMIHSLRGSTCPTLNCVVALRDKDIPLFAKMIPNVRVKFSLITLGTRDMPSAFSRSVVRTISTSPWLVAWYMQNLDDTAQSNGKMHVFPLGIDYHTLAGSLAQQRGVGAEGTFGLAETSSPQEQDNRVKAIYTAARPWADRPRMLYVGKYGDTHATRKTTEFKSIPERVRGALRVQERQPRWSMLEGVAECKFVLAPRGLGMSSIRFYEALALGSVPICDRLPSKSMNRLHRQLGAIIVDSWADVTDENLVAWSTAISTGRYSATPHTRHLTKVDRAVLSTRFWINCAANGVDCLAVL